MHRFRLLYAVLPGLLLLQPAIASAEPAAASAGSALLRFSVSEGRVQNEFFREGPIAAHVVLTSGAEPRLVFAFPAGNSGAAVWFDTAQGPLAWQPGTTLEPMEREVGGGTLRGVAAEIAAKGAPVTIRHVIASNVRVIRDYGYTGKTPPEVTTPPQLTGNTVVWRRERLDGAPGYYLSIEVLTGTLAGGDGKPIELRPDADGNLRLRVTGLTGDEPLAPIPQDALLNAAAQPDPRLRHILAFLSYEQKLLAGSWRFNTYFGRDTLMSLELLLPALQPGPVEAGLSAVLERLDAVGEVAHEEDIGEYAVLRHLAEGDGASAAPIYDYKMIDDDFLLPIVAGHYLLDNPEGSRRAAAFLARKTASGEPYGAALVRNFSFVVSAAAGFAHDAQWRNLVSLKPGWNVGNWRDSEEGLGGGRYPYDVNGVLVPAALAAIARFHESGLLEPYAEPDTAATLGGAHRFARTWQLQAPELFLTTLPPDAARDEVVRYAKRIGVDSKSALEALGDAPVRFHAVALDAAGRPVPILNSDEGFALLFLDLAPERAAQVVETLMRPFPGGLMTDVGLLVANPAYARDTLEPEFGRNRYHGTVIWSWQQAVLAAGIARQLESNRLTPSACTALIDARERLHAAMARAHAVRGSELWSWSEKDGRYAIEPFGQRSGDVTESNAAQLWSTVQLYSPYEQLGESALGACAGG